MRDQETTAYLEHVAGMAALLDWIAELESTGHRVDVGPRQIALDEVCARRFCVGVPKSRLFGRHPFLAAQPREVSFLRLVRFDRAVLRRGGRELALVASFIAGDGEQFPDISAFALVIPFDEAQKAAALGQSPFLEARPFSIDEEGEIEVGTRDVLWRLPLSVIGPDDELLGERETRPELTVSELVKRRLERTNVERDPGFEEARASRR